MAAGRSGRRRLQIVVQNGWVTPGLVAAHDLVVAMDYGQFRLRGELASFHSDRALLDEAQNDGAGVAADGRTVLFLSPHQSNFDMVLRVEVWDRKPSDDLDDWQEVFATLMEVDADGRLWFESPTLTVVGCDVPPGRYRVLVAGRGFVARGRPGPTGPSDSWRVQLWPAEGDSPSCRLRSSDPSWAAPPATASAGTVSWTSSPEWKARLRDELFGQPPGQTCCRRAEAAALLRMARGGPAENLPIDSSQIVRRLEMLLGDQASQPGLHTELGLRNAAGVPVRGLPPRLLTVGSCCAAAVWRGAFVLGGDLFVRSKHLHAVVRCPNAETALGLVGIGRHLGIGQMTLREPGAGDDGHDVLVPDGLALLEIVAARGTATEWRNHCA